MLDGFRHGRLAVVHANPRARSGVDDFAALVHVGVHGMLGPRQHRLKDRLGELCSLDTRVLAVEPTITPRDPRHAGP